MNTEEKAKAYDKALERARKIYDEILDNELLGFPDQIRRIFPELAENDDERIRNELIEYLTHRAEITGFIDEEKDCKRWIAYLEKQKEIDVLDEEEREFADNVDSFRQACDEAYQNGFNNGVKSVNTVEWSEEDKNKIEKAIWLIQHYATDGHKKLLREEVISGLKSLRPQSHWKPSEEQKYDGNVDKECIKLCDILNSTQSIDTFESCCGHLKDRYSIWFFCNDITTVSRLGRCVERNYSDGKWELLVDSTDTHPTGVFWLRSKVPFQSYDEMEKSVNGLCNNIQYWFNTKFDSHFNDNTGKQDESVEVKPEEHWKPSEEQMDALKEASASWMNQEMGNCELLESLYNDLKKL